MKETITREAPGHSWITGDKAPTITGWVCFFVSHYGTDRTVWTYKRTAAKSS
jgi:hypothetical protein